MSDNIEFSSVSFHLNVSKSIFEFGESADIESAGFSLHSTIRFLGKIKTYTDDDFLTIEYTNDKGEKIKPDVSKGDKVVYSKYGGTEIKVDGQEYLILSSRDILAKLGK